MIVNTDIGQGNDCCAPQEPITPQNPRDKKNVRGGKNQHRERGGQYRGNGYDRKTHMEPFRASAR